MKKTTIPLLVALLGALPLLAEEKARAEAPSVAASEPVADLAPPPLAPAERDQDRLELMPSKPAQLLPPPSGYPLIPEIPRPTEKPRQRSIESPIQKRDSATAESEDLIKQRIRMREAKTKAQRDPAVQAELERSAAVRTDYEKREALKNYYRRLYARMAKIDPAVKSQTDLQLRESLQRLEQNRIAPTQPPIVAEGSRARR